MMDKNRIWNICFAKQRAGRIDLQNIPKGARLFRAHQYGDTAFAVSVCDGWGMRTISAIYPKRKASGFRSDSGIKSLLDGYSLETISIYDVYADEESAPNGEWVLAKDGAAPASVMATLERLADEQKQKKEAESRKMQEEFDAKVQKGRELLDAAAKRLGFDSLPAGVIVANRNDADPKQSYIIGFSRHTRRLFPEMRKCMMAGIVPGLLELAMNGAEAECRHNWKFNQENCLHNNKLNDFWVTKDILYTKEWDTHYCLIAANGGLMV